MEIPLNWLKSCKNENNAKISHQKMQKLECWLEILPISCCQKFPFLGPPKVLTASFLKSWSPFQFQLRFLVVLASLDFKLSLSKSLSEWFPFFGFSEKQEGGLSQSYFFVWWGFLASWEKKLKIATFTEAPFMVKLDFWNYKYSSSNICAIIPG